MNSCFLFWSASGPARKGGTLVSNCTGRGGHRIIMNSCFLFWSASGPARKGGTLVSNWGWRPGLLVCCVLVSSVMRSRCPARGRIPGLGLFIHTLVCVCRRMPLSQGQWVLIQRFNLNIVGALYSRFIMFLLWRTLWVPLSEVYACVPLGFP
jgi:hypothetical protein